MKSHKDEVTKMNEVHGERITRLEVTQEHIFNSLMDIRSELKEFKTEIRSDISDLRSEMKDIRTMMWRFHFWNLAGLAALLGVMSHGFGWI